MNKLKTFRQMHKISQKELANVLCTTQQQISLYETGKRTKYSERVSRLFLAGYPFFSNYLKLYPTRTKKTAAKANKKQRKTEHKESGKADRKERNNHKQKPKTKTTPRNHNI